MRLTFIFFLLSLSVFGQHPYFSNNYFTFHFKAQQNSIRITSQGKDTLISNSSFRQEMIDLETGDTVRINEYIISNYFKMEQAGSVYTWKDSTPYCATEF